MKSTTTTGIIRSFPSFDYFLEKAKHRISHFPQKHQDELNINRLSLFNYWRGILGIFNYICSIIENALCKNDFNCQTNKILLLK